MSINCHRPSATSCSEVRSKPTSIPRISFTSIACGRQGQDEPFSSGGTKDDAVAAGREEATADQVEHIIKNQNGRIGERNSYGNDPRHIPG
jgi:hypothetical protein